MMTSLKELNGKVWYRFLKIVYILCYLPLFLLLFLVIYNGGRDYNDPILPNTIKEVMNDPEFYKLNDYDMREVLSSIESKSKDTKVKITDTVENKIVKFNDLSIDEQLEVINSIKNKPKPKKSLPRKYEYKSFYTWNIVNCILYGFLTIFCYVVFMEGIRRGFYYVVIGKVFPKE